MMNSTSKVIFDNLLEFISSQLNCPLCDQELKIEVLSSIKTANEISDSLFDGSQLIFKLIGPIEFPLNINAFKIIISSNLNISYDIVDPEYWDKEAEKIHFIKLFIDTYIQITQTCNNLYCSWKYYRTSGPLNIVNLDDSKIANIKLYFEIFNYNNYVFINDFTNGMLQIYNHSESSSSSDSSIIEVPLINLTKETSESLINKIKIITVFF